MRLLTMLLAFVTFARALQGQSPADDPAGHAKDVLTALGARDFPKVESQFTDKMKAALPRGLEAGWTQLTAQAGAFKSCGAAHVQAMANMQLTITPCEFERATVDAQVVFDREGRIAGLSFRPAAAAAASYSPPGYAIPASYTESDVTVGSGQWPLPATLDMPTGVGPFPALVLVHGFGPSDRDETILSNKPADKSNVAFHSYPALNHLFVSGTGKSVPAEYRTPGHVDEAVIRDIADWIKR